MASENPEVRIFSQFKDEHYGDNIIKFFIIVIFLFFPLYSGIACFHSSKLFITVFQVFSSKSSDCELDQSNGSANLDNMFDKNNRPNAPGPNNKYWDDSPDQDHSRGSLTDESSMSGGLSVTGKNQSID